MLRKGVPDSREMPERVTWMVDKIYRTASEEHERCRKFLKALAILSVVLRECLEETLMRKLNRIGHQVQQARPDAFRLGKSGAEVATEKVELGNRFKWLSGTLHLFVRKCHDSLSDVDELEKKVDAFLDELTKAVQELQTLLEELQDFFQQIEAMKSHVEDESCRSRLESWQMKLIEIIKEELLLHPEGAEVGLRGIACNFLELPSDLQEQMLQAGYASPSCVRDTAVSEQSEPAH